MIAQSSSASRHHDRLGTRLVTLALLTLAALPGALGAESGGRRVVTTILPRLVVAPGADAKTFSTSEEVVLDFETGALPVKPGAETAALRLVCQDMLTRGDGRVRAQFKGSEAVFGSRSFNQNQPGLGGASVWRTTEAPGDLEGAATGTSAFGLVLKPTQPAVGRRWHSIGASSKNRPRLVFEYTIPDLPEVTEAGGLPSSQSRSAFLPRIGSEKWLSAVRARPVRTTAVWSRAPVFYNGRVYLITNEGGRKSLQALRPLGGEALPAVPLQDPGQHLVLSDSGRLYIVGNQRVLVYQLHPADSHKPATEVSKLRSVLPRAFDPPLADFNPELEPAAGLDSSLYFVNLHQVFGLNPDLQELWRVSLDEKGTSRVTVGPSGRFVYLLGKKDGAVGLITIDARTGEFTAKPMPNADKLGPVDATLHAPLVLRAPPGSTSLEKIYVAANSANGGALTCFDNQSTDALAFGAPVIEPCLDPSQTPPAPWTALSGRFGQPAFGPRSDEGDKRIYAVQVADGRGWLSSIHWANGSSATMGSDFAVDASESVLKAGNLAFDRDGTVFVWNPKGAESKLQAVTRSPSVALHASFEGSEVPAAEARLMFGTDGTLYANNPSGELRAIVPDYEVADTMTEGKAISSETHLRLDGVVPAGDWRIATAGRVFLGRGFKVKKGATLQMMRGDTYRVVRRLHWRPAPLDSCDGSPSSRCWYREDFSDDPMIRLLCQDGDGCSLEVYSIKNGEKTPAGHGSWPYYPANGLGAKVGNPACVFWGNVFELSSRLYEISGRSAWGETLTIHFSPGRYMPDSCEFTIRDLPKNGG